MRVRSTRYWIWLGVGTGLSVAWLTAIAVYVTRLIGWNNILFLLPHELGAFLLGIFAPPAFLWLALVYIASHAKVTDVTVALEARLDKLIYPPSGADIEVNSVVEALERHAQALSDANEAAANLAENRIRQAVGDLEQRIGEAGLALEGAAELACRRVEDMASVLDMRRNDLAQVAQRVGEDADRFTDVLDVRCKGLDDSAAALAERGEVISKLIADQQISLEGATDRLESRVKSIGDHLAVETNRLVTESDHAAAGVAELAENCRSGMVAMRAEYANLAAEAEQAAKAVTGESRGLGQEAKRMTAVLIGGAGELSARAREIIESGER